MRLGTVLLLLTTAAVLAATAAAWIVARDETRALAGRVDEGLSLKKSNVVTEADRYRYLPDVVAQDDRILKLLDGPDDPIRVDLANRYLETVNRSAGTHDLFILDATGTTLASSNWQDADNRVGKNYGFRVYFKDAFCVATGEGRQYAIGATGGIPGYYLAHRVETPALGLGVAVVKVHLSPLEDAWAEAGERVGLVDRAGMIFISNVEDWKYYPLYPLSKNDREKLERERQYRLEFLKRSPLQPDRELKSGQTFYLTVQDRRMLVRLLDIPSHDWRILAAVDVAPVYAAAYRNAAIIFLVAALLIAAGFYLHERRERVQADRLRTILEDMSIGIAVFDPDLRLVAWNSPYIRLNSYPETLVRADRPLAEIIEHNAQRGDYGPGDPKQQVQMRLDRVRQQPVRQTELRRPDGTWLDMRHSRTSEGWIVRTYSDISERKQAEEELSAHRNNLERLVEQRTAELVHLNERLEQRTAQLVHLNERLREAVEQAEQSKALAEQADRAKTSFLNAVSHDIRNPLNAILGYAGLVLANSKQALPDKQYQNLEKLVAKGHELNELVHGFLDYSRADQIETGRFALGPLIRDCLATIEPTIDGEQVGLSSDIPAGLPALVQDEKKLRRVIHNLLNNAAKFTEKGAIRIAAARQQDQIEIAVSDTGRGIPEDSLDRIFEEFVRVETRGARPREGAGLGLAICHRFAALMAGKIVVRSKVGEGSTFTLSIPIVHPKAAPSDAQRDAEAISGDRLEMDGSDVRARLLIVDDSKENRDFLTQLLERRYHLLTAEDGKKAIEIVRQEQPDLVLMDLSLPIMDGWEATRIIKSDPKLRAIPIIAVTAHATAQDRDAVKAAGCDDFFAKPVDEKALLDAIARHLGMHEAPDG